MALNELDPNSPIDPGQMSPDGNGLMQMLQADEASKANGGEQPDMVDRETPDPPERRSARADHRPRLE